MKRGVRVKEGEDLSEAKLKEVIAKLEADKPITKKEACEMLNITYNTTRLNRIIEEYKENIAYHEKRKKELRKTPLTKEDVAFIISSYLEEGNLSAIEQSTHRGLAVIKRVLNKYNIPLRTASTTYHNPIFLSDDSITEEYIKDDLVYSARYDQPAYISSKFKDVYRVWLIKDEQYAMQPYYELGDLRRLQTDLSIKIETRKFWDDNEMQSKIAEALRNANKRNKST